jgi:hypothetical protein
MNKVFKVIAFMLIVVFVTSRSVFLETLQDDPEICVTKGLEGDKCDTPAECCTKKMFLCLAGECTHRCAAGLNCEKPEDPKICVTKGLEGDKCASHDDCCTKKMFLCLAGECTHRCLAGVNC